MEATPRKILDRQETYEFFRRIVKLCRFDVDTKRRVLKNADVIDLGPEGISILLQAPKVGVWLLFTEIQGILASSLLAVSSKKAHARTALVSYVAPLNHNTIIGELRKYESIEAVDDVTNLPEAASLCVDFLKKWISVIEEIEGEIVEKKAEIRQKAEQEQQEKREQLVERVAQKSALLASVDLS